MQLKGSRLCYTVGANTEIQGVNLVAYRATNGFATSYNQVIDNIVRSDSTCRNYSIVAHLEIRGGRFCKCECKFPPDLRVCTDWFHFLDYWANQYISHLALIQAL